MLVGCGDVSDLPPFVRVLSKFFGQFHNVLMRGLAHAPR
jgi:hypothetical protein